MSDNPRPDDDERWTVGEELEEENTEENLEPDKEDKGLFGMSRRQSIGLGAAVLGLGGAGLAVYAWDGGDFSPNSPTNTSGGNGIGDDGSDMAYPGITNPNISDDSDLGVDTDPVNDTDNSTDTTPTPPEDESVYELEDGVTVDLDYLDSIFNDSSAEMGVQENGNLVAWNSEVEIERDDGTTYNPLRRFRSDVFPDREFYEVEGDHPVEQIFDELEVEVDEMTEGMVNVFFDDETSDGSWKDHREYKPVEYEELKKGLLEYGGLGPAQDYFFNRHETLRSGEQTLEEEWRHLLKDGL